MVKEGKPEKVKRNTKTKKAPTKSKKK
jgi:hypothetical protein